MDLVDLTANHYESTRLAAICGTAFVNLFLAVYLLGRIRLGLAPATARVSAYRRSLMLVTGVAMGSGSVLLLFLFALAQDRPFAA